MNYIQNEIARDADSKAEKTEEGLQELNDMQLVLVGGGIADPILR